MARRFIVRPLAEADLEDAARWYEEERVGLAERCYILFLMLLTFERPTKWSSYLRYCI